MHLPFLSRTTLLKSKPKLTARTILLNLYALAFARPMSQSTSLPRNQTRVRDHGFDNYMDVQKKVIKVLKFHDLFLQQPLQTLPVTTLDMLARRLGFKRLEAGAFVLKYPHVYEIYEHPVRRILYCRLTRKVISQIEQERQALEDQLPDAVMRLRKLLMMSKTGRLRLEHVRIARKEFGLPDDFEYSVILKNPQFFRLFDAKDTRNKYIEVVERDPKLGICAIEMKREMEYREKGIDAEDMRFSFIVNFPPGFKFRKYFKTAVWRWQRMPYWSPYEDISGYDLRSLEAQKRMEKRAVATIHELLSLTVEKKITMERIAHFRMAMDLPKKIMAFLLQHQGIFYISTRGNYGKIHTVFLREAYWKGELIEPNDLYLARRKLAELVLLSYRKAKVDRELFNYDRMERDHQMGNLQSNYGVDSKTQYESRQDNEEDLKSHAESDFSDEDSDIGESHAESDFSDENSDIGDFKNSAVAE